MNNNDVWAMVDIETLGLKSDAAVIAIGAIIFDRNGPSYKEGHAFEVLINPISAPGSRDSDTLLNFWFNPDKVAPDVRERMFSGDVMTDDAMYMFAKWLRDNNVDQLWANPPQFDCVVLQSTYDTTNTDNPIDWFQYRDCRTMYRLAQRLGIDYRAAGVNNKPHDALADAESQAARVAYILDNIDHYYERGLSLDEG